MMDYRKTIAALLAKAESTNHPAEAEVFQQKAEALMIKWGIDDAMLESRDTSVKPNVIEVRFTSKGIYADAYIKLFAPAIVRGLGGMRLLLSARKGELYIIGLGSDVNRALELLDSLTTQADHAMKAWWKSYEGKQYLTGSEGYRERRTFIVGFGAQVGKRLAAIREAQVAAAASEVGTALAIRTGVVDEYFANEYPNLKYSTTKLKGGYRGAAAGREAGNRAGLGGAKIGSGSHQAIS